MLRLVALRSPGRSRWAARSWVGYDSGVPVGYLVQVAFDCARWIPPAWVRRYALRAWVLLAANLAVLAMLSFCWPSPDRSIEMFATAVGLTALAMTWAARRSPDLLEVASGTTLARLLAAIALHTLAGYVALIPLAGGFAYLLVVLRGDPRHPRHCGRAGALLALAVLGPCQADRRGALT